MTIQFNGTSLMKALCALCMLAQADNVHVHLEIETGGCVSHRPSMIVAGPDGGPKRSYITPETEPKPRPPLGMAAALAHHVAKVRFCFPMKCFVGRDRRNDQRHDHDTEQVEP